MTDDSVFKFMGFPIRMATPGQIMKAMARSPRVYADENLVVAQDTDGTVYIDTNRAADDLPKSDEDE